MADALLGIETADSMVKRLSTIRFTLADALLGIETYQIINDESGDWSFTLADALLGIETTTKPCTTRKLIPVSLWLMPF